MSRPFRTAFPLVLAAWLLPLVHPFSHGHETHPAARCRLETPAHAHPRHGVHAHNENLCQACQAFRKITAADTDAALLPSIPFCLGDSSGQALPPLRQAAGTHRPIRAPPA